MDKQEFEQKIVNLLVEAGYVKEGQLTKKIDISMDGDFLPEVTVSYLVTPENGK